MINLRLLILLALCGLLARPVQAQTPVAPEDSLRGKREPPRF